MFGSILTVLLAIQQAAPGAATVEPALLAAVERFFATQEQEDIEAYLALWSPNARAPSAEQLRFIFDNGDDRFTDLRVLRVAHTEGRARLRISIARERTVPTAKPGGGPIVFASRPEVALTFERLADGWKLLREGRPADDLAAALVDTASPEARDALLAGEPDLHGPELLSALGRLASGAAQQADYARSRDVSELLLRLAREGGHRQQEGEALQNIATALYFQQRLPEALAAYETRLTVERERRDEGGIAAALAGAASVHYALAQYTDALERYREALPLQQRLEDVAGQAATTLSLGHIAYIRGEFESAIESYQRSLTLNRSMQYAGGEAQAREGLGRVLMARGDHTAALKVFDETRTDPRLNALPDQRAAAGANVADVHVRLGNLEEARTRYEESRRIFDARRNAAGTGRALQGLAFVELLAARFVLAEDLYRQSEKACALASERGCRAAALAGLAAAQYAQDRFEEAARAYRAAAAAFAEEGAHEQAARCDVGLSSALTGSGDYAAAIEAAFRARTTAENLANDDVLWRAFTVEARAVRTKGDIDRALGAARQAGAVLERMERAALDRPGTALPSDSADALALLAVLQAERGDADAALTTAERLRILQLRASLAPTEREIARGMTDAERDRERLLAADALTRLAQLEREQRLPKPDPARIRDLQAVAAEAARARRLWLDDLFARLPHLPVWRGLAPPRRPHELWPVLAADTLVVSLVVDADALLVLTVAAFDGELRVTSSVAAVPRRTIAEHVAALLQPDALSNAARWRERGLALLALVPARLRAQMAAASRIVVLPDDVLWRVPFEALPDGDGVLLDRAEVSVAASFEHLLRHGAATYKGGALLAAGAPALGAERLADLAQVAPAWSVRRDDEAMRELERSLAAYGGDGVVRLTAAEVTERAVRRGLATASVAHLAAPFRLNPGSPMFSPILLADQPQTDEPLAAAGRSEDDGALELRELFELTADATLVALSDGSALSMRNAAAAAGVLHWGWLAAGVPSLLVARWAGPWEAAGALLADVHRHVREGTPPAAALRAAQLAIRRNPATAAPVHGAGWLGLSSRSQGVQ